MPICERFGEQVGAAWPVSCLLQTREKTMAGELTHFDEDGASRMVDVGSKEVSQRIARASGRVRMAPETLRLVRDRRDRKSVV